MGCIQSILFYFFISLDIIILHQGRTAHKLLKFEHIINTLIFFLYRRGGSGMSHDLSAGGQDGNTVSRVERGLALLHSVRFVSETRQRSKFIPFLLRNNTGLPLQFATLTSVPSKVVGEGREGGREDQWVRE